jgi:hypothetical protein
MIVCDSCEANGTTFVSPKKAHAARTALRKLGWVVSQPGGCDYCPDCVREMRIATSALR